MELVVLVLSLFSPDTRPLGHDDWEVREKCSARYDNLLYSLLLPRSDADPEIDYRLKAIHRRHPIEGMVKRQSYSLWVKWYVLEGESGLQKPEDVFFELHDQTMPERATEFFRQAPDPGREYYLRQGVCPGEYEKFRERIARYRSSKGK